MRGNGERKKINLGSIICFHILQRDDLMPTVWIRRKGSTKGSAEAERSGTSPLSPPGRAITDAIAGTFLGSTHPFIQRAPTPVLWPMEPGKTHSDTLLAPDFLFSVPRSNSRRLEVRSVSVSVPGWSDQPGDSAPPIPRGRFPPPPPGCSRSLIMINFLLEAIHYRLPPKHLWSWTPDTSPSISPDSRGDERKEGRGGEERRTNHTSSYSH